MVMAKPALLFDRVWEWAALDRFVGEGGDEPRLGLMYGRRRQGKSLLASQLCASTGGFYWEALETEATGNLEHLGAAWAAHTSSPGPIRFGSWADALAELVRAGGRGFGKVVVLDEIQRVIVKAPELPSVLQSLLGPGGLGVRAGGTRLILCGSAFGELRRLIEGTAPLRGRAGLELIVEPFPYRVAADFWGVASNPTLAFRLHALIGGTPAYRDLAGGDTPAGDGDLDGWVARRLLEPSSSLFREGRIVVHEDPQLGDPQLYWGLLSAVADGARRWTDLEAALGVNRGVLQHALAVTTDAGWLVRVADPLRANRTVYTLTEPMVRFHRLVVETHQRRLAQRRGADVWIDAAPAVASQIYGPHLEALTAEWLVAHASAETCGGTILDVGPTSIAGVGQIDLVATAAGLRGGRRPILVAEVKATSERVGPTELERLDRAVERLDQPDLVRMLVSAAGFTGDLERLARQRGNVQLVDLSRLYHGT